MPGGPSPVIELMDPRHHVFGDDRTNETIPRFRLTDSLATAAEPNPNGRARAAYQGPGPAGQPEDEPEHPNVPAGSIHGRRARTARLLGYVTRMTKSSGAGNATGGSPIQAYSSDESRPASANSSTESPSPVATSARTGTRSCVTALATDSSTLT